MADVLLAGSITVASTVSGDLDIFEKQSDGFETADGHTLGNSLETHPNWSKSAGAVSVTIASRSSQQCASGTGLGASANGYKSYRWTRPTIPTSGVFNLYAQVEASGNTAAIQFRTFDHLTGNGDGYALALDPTNGYVTLIEWDNLVLQWQENFGTVSAGSIYWIKLQLDYDSGTVRGKVWSGAITAEPATWGVSRSTTILDGDHCHVIWSSSHATLGDAYMYEVGFENEVQLAGAVAATSTVSGTMAVSDMFGSIDAVSEVPAAPLLVALKTPGSWLWDFERLGSDGDLLKNILDGYGGYWEPQAVPDTDAPYDLDTVSSQLYLRLYQATTGGAYDWWKADPTLWAARRTTVWRVRVLGYFEDSDTAKSMRIRMYEGAEYVSFQFDGDRLEIRDSSGRKVIQTGYNSGAFTAVLEITGTTARFRRINSHDPDLAFGSWDQTTTVRTIDPESSDFVLANGNKGADENHGFIKTLELFFADTALGGDITATSTVSGSLSTENPVPLAGTITAVSTVAGALTIPVDVTLAGTITAVSTVAGALTVPSEIPIAGTITAVSAVGAYLNVPEAPELRRGLRLVAPGGRHPLRRIPFGWIRRDQAYTIRLEIVAERALTAPTLWAGSTWFRGQLDGAGFVTIGNDRATALALGAFVKGQRKEFDLELIVPAAGEIRVDLLEINLGIGIDY